MGKEPVTISFPTRTCVIMGLPEVVSYFRQWLKRCLIRVSTWVGNLTADVSYWLVVDAARQLSIRLLTVSHVSYSVSQSGVFNQACSQLVANQFLSQLWLVAGLLLYPVS